MIEPWQSLPMSSSDPTTIAEYIAAQIALHDADPSAHMGDNASLQVHRSQDELDHPAESVQAQHVGNDVLGVGRKAGTFAQQGQEWHQSTTVLDAAYQHVTWADYDDGLFIAVGNSGAVATSPDGDTWTEATIDSGTNWFGVCYANGVFVMVGWTNPGLVIKYSTDAVTWTTASVGSHYSGSPPIWDGTKFVMLFIEGSGFPSTSKIYTSTDGATWTGAASNTPVLFNRIYSGTPDGVYYVADASNSLYGSADLSTWTENFAPANASNFVVAWGPLGFTGSYDTDYFIGDTEVIEYYVTASVDGVSWSKLPAPSQNAAQEAVFTANTYLIACNGLAGDSIELSSNGIIYTCVAVPYDGGLLSIVASPIRIVAVPFSFGSAPFVYSDLNL